MHLDEYMKTIDVPKFEAVLRQLAAEKPDFRYIEPGTIYAYCRYDGPARKKGTGKIAGNPCSGCIFGQAFQREGVTHGLDIGRSIDRIAKDQTESTKLRWGRLQANQDSGDTWGEAIKHLGEENA